MTSSITDVKYSYPIATTIGCKDISITESIVENSKIYNIRQAYDSLFSNYSKKAETLLNVLGKDILGKELTFEDIKKIENIFDDDDIISGNIDGSYKESKEGLKAYKFYFKDILTKLNDLNEIITKANTITNSTDGTLTHLQAKNEDTLNNDAHVLITNLQNYDKQAQDILKSFAEYSVVKNLTVTKFISYNDGENDHIDEETDQKSFESIEKAYRSYDNLISKTKDCNSIENLRNIETDKYNINREYHTIYEASAIKLADKYDLLAKIKINEQETLDSTDTSVIDLFDELTLLEKLQYIRIYYKDAKATRYVFPEDNSFGYPCIKPTESTDALNDTKQLGNVELFYLGYIINRDGPINSLASFLEIKTTAIQSQIKVVMERIKAIKAYSTLLQKGFEQLSSVASTYNPIPKAAFYIYRYLSTSATRCFYYYNNEPYIMVQYSLADTGEFSKDADKEPDDSTNKNNWNESPSKYYILVKATEEGFNSFVNFLNGIPTIDLDKHDRILDLLFSIKEVETYNTDLTKGAGHECKYKYFFYSHYFARLSQTNTSGEPFDQFKICANLKYNHLLFLIYDLDQQKWENIAKNLYCLKNPVTLQTDGNNVHFVKIDDKNKLPKKLDVPKMKGSAFTQVPWDDDVAWNDMYPKELKRKDILPGFFGAWKGNYETQISNYKTNLDQQEKEISTLQKKIQTFDATTTNFRNKAFTVYNKIVNKIK